MATSASSPNGARDPRSDLSRRPFNNFLVWREFVWGGIAGAFGEGLMHPVDTLKTRLQSQAILAEHQGQKNILQMIQTVWAADGLRGFYRGIAPGVTGSLATGATYFGVIESTKQLLEEVNPNLSSHWSHFIAGAIGDTLGSIVYVPCEVIKQRMQVQGTRTSWSSMLMKESATQNSGVQIYDYYTGIFQAGHSIWKQHGLKGLYAGYWSTLARDVPFAGLMVTFYDLQCMFFSQILVYTCKRCAVSGLMVTFYEALKDLTKYGKQRLLPGSDMNVNSTFEGLLLGGLAGGFSAYLTTPLDVIKTRMQVQGSTMRYNGWLDALTSIWKTEGLNGMFKGSVPRIMWYIPASALTFMAVEFLRDQFNEKRVPDIHEITSLSIDVSSKIQKAGR